MSVVISNLTKIYGQQKAIDQISFTINQGEIVGFLGPNGAGKSTTLKIITGYLKADSGKVTIDHIDVSNEALAAKKKIGYLPEANPLYNEMYIREYLEFVGNLHQIKNLKERVEEVINMTGLKLESNKRIGQVSKGYKQRTGIAAALIHDPEVLILDEPTSGLDPNQILEIREVIKSLGKHKTILFSSHILQEVEAMCDRVIIINKGKIVADDIISNLKLKGNEVEHVIVEFDTIVNLELLENLKGVESIQCIADKKWQIQTKNIDLTKKQILEMSLQHSLNIVSLQSEKNSLEQIFRNLTS